MIKPTGISHVAMITGDLDCYRGFYEHVIGIDTALVHGAGVGHGRHAIFFAGNTVLHVFERIGYDPAQHGNGTGMFERGRLDHLGFSVPDESALSEVRDRLVTAGASTGDIRPLGPTLSVRYCDPDGFEGEINCFNPDFDPAAVGPHDDVVDPDWHERAKRLLNAGAMPSIGAA